MVNMSRTVWQQGTHATECCLWVPGEATLTVRNVPWRLRTYASEPSDFGLGPVVLDADVTEP